MKLKLGKWHINEIYCTDALEGLKQLPERSINCCITSPPYWNQRDYGTPGQYGLEQTPEEYISNMASVFKEVFRVLTDDGTLWLNMGDAYWGSGKAGKNTSYQDRHTEFGRPSRKKERFEVATTATHPLLKPKDLIGLPWKLAFALHSQGWYLRQDLIWCKPNPMPESVRDRCTKAHEYIFLLSKSAKYYFDQKAIMQPLAAASVQRLSQNIANQKGSNRVPGKTNGTMKAVGHYVGGKKHKNLANKGQSIHSFHRTRSQGKEWQNKTGMANRRSVWTIATKPFSEAHFATFPPELAELCIKAGCPEGGIILDPFMGAGTTALTCLELNRNYLGFELNPEYIEIARKRLAKAHHLFNQSDT